MPVPLAIALASSVSSACAGRLPQGVAESPDDDARPGIAAVENGGGGRKEGGGGGGTNEGGGGRPNAPAPDLGTGGYWAGKAPDLGADGEPNAEPPPENAEPGAGRSNA